jgi:hypothetical protein
VIALLAGLGGVLFALGVGLIVIVACLLLADGLWALVKHFRR